MSDTYTLFEHRHRFSVWAAARAAQRALAGAKVGVLSRAIEAGGIKKVVADPQRWPADAKEFDAFHKQLCRKLTSLLRRAGLIQATYGRAAKLTAIHLKSMIINGPDAHTPFVALIHPPIDRVLLQNLAACRNHPTASCCLWRQTAWTALDEPSYFAIIESLRACGLDQPAFWTIERFWNAANE